MAGPFFDRLEKFRKKARGEDQSGNEKEDSTWMSKQLEPVVTKLMKEMEPLLIQAQETAQAVKDAVLKMERSSNETNKLLRDILDELQKKK